ncbi:MAG: hypothetical protein HY820_15255 [Acidobacteria bacterium]|nr:hypothetical protein [Acidobacteriota bacterium]
MSTIEQQVHSKFKIFVGELAPDKTIGPLADEVAAFASSAGIAAKSIGVEYVESAKRLIISLGYRDDEEAYPIRLHCIPLGGIGMLTGDFAALEKAMMDASSRLPNIICHELYVTNTGDFFMVFMTHR